MIIVGFTLYVGLALVVAQICSTPDDDEILAELAREDRRLEAERALEAEEADIAKIR